MMPRLLITRLLTPQLLAAACSLLAALPAAQAQPANNGLISSSQIFNALTTPATGDDVLTRRFRPKANPNAETRVCDATLSRSLENSSGQRGEQLTRDLYIDNVAAPKVDLDIAFQLGEATLLPEGRKQLDQLAEALKTPALQAQRFVLAGHTDSEGGKEYNDRLSCERALSVRRYLVERYRLGSERLIPMGFGFERLKDSANPRAAANRRVEVRVYPKP